VNTLLVFAREPRPGRVKTRLAAGIGAAAACQLYRAFLQDLAGHLGTLAETRVIWWVDGHASKLREAVGAAWQSQWQVHGQPEGHLGIRLETAFRSAFAASPHAVAVIGSDCPHLNPELLSDLFVPLAGGADAVLLPARDGGYAGLALAAPCKEAFQNVPWSTDRVAEVTLANLRQSGREAVTLLPVFDVDTAADLQVLGKLLATHPELAPHTAALLAALEASQ